MPDFTRYSVLFKARAHGLVSDRYLSALQGAISDADTVTQWMHFKIQEGQAYPQFCGVQISAGSNEREQATNPISSRVLTIFCNRLDYSRTITPGDQSDRRRASVASIVSDGMAPHGSERLHLVS